VTGYRNFDSTEAPFQKFRWIHFPYEPKGGDYTYRVTKRHMKDNGSLFAGTSITLDISLDVSVYDGFLDVGFARNYASSQAYADQFGNRADIIPPENESGLDFKKKKADDEIYRWLGFEAYDLIFGFLDDAVADNTIEIDCFAYDLNEPDIVDRLSQLGSRLRIIIDDSGTHKPQDSDESRAAAILSKSAGKKNVQRMHFSGLQHNKVLIAKRDGQAFKVLHGSTNFSFRGIYIQANNALVFRDPQIAGLFEEVFETAFTDGVKGFNKQAITQQWHMVQSASRPPVHFCFSPHEDADLSLSPVGAAIDQASSSVLFCIAFLNQSTSGAVREAVDRLEEKPVFSYGISDRVGGLNVMKPDGSIGIVDFQYLADHAPEPFKSEWSGGSGRHEHHKFVVTDFNLPTAKVFTGSSNLSVSGEQKNGDNLVMIEDQRVATSYAIEALRVFDHLHFRTVMEKAGAGGRKGRGAGGDQNDQLVLAKPTSISGKPAWFKKYYDEGTQAERDRKLFSH